MTATYEDRTAPPTGRPTRGWMAPVLVAAGAVAASAYVFANDPSDGGAFIPCPFHNLTGLWCPGCGLTRATHHLLHGDVMGALGRNLLLPLMLAGTLWAWAAWTLRRTGRPTRGLDTVPGPVWVVLGVGAVVFAVVRNLPFGAALAP